MTITVMLGRRSSRVRLRVLGLSSLRPDSQQKPLAQAENENSTCRIRIIGFMKNRCAKEVLGRLLGSSIGVYVEHQILSDSLPARKQSRSWMSGHLARAALRDAAFRPLPRPPCRRSGGRCRA